MYLWLWKVEKGNLISELVDGLDILSAFLMRFCYFAVVPVADVIRIRTGKPLFSSNTDAFLCILFWWIKPCIFLIIQTFLFCDYDDIWQHSFLPCTIFRWTWREGWKDDRRVVRHDIFCMTGSKATCAAQDLHLKLS